MKRIRKLKTIKLNLSAASENNDHLNRWMLAHAPRYPKEYSDALANRLRESPHFVDLKDIQ